MIKCEASHRGQGIKPEEPLEICQTFEQAGFYENRNIGGISQGFAMSKNLTELMGGSVAVEKNYGARLKFTVNIPQDAANDLPIMKINDAHNKCIVLHHSNKPLVYIWQRSLARLGVSSRAVFDEDGLYRAAADKRTTHILIDNDMALALKMANIAPHAAAACLVAPTTIAQEQPEQLCILFKPLLLFDFASFLNNEEAESSRALTASGKLLDRSYPHARVLIVDDSEVNRIIATEIMKAYDIEAVTASSGAEALEKVKETGYDLIFMDHMMPGMDGIETTAAIRSLDIAQPAVIALTPNAMLGGEEIYRQSGFDDYITKPIAVDSLNEILSKLLKK